MNNLREYIIDILKSFAEDGSLKVGTQNREEILKICSRNRLLPVIYKVSAWPSLKNKYKESAISTLLYECEIRKIFNRFNAVGIRAILLRGLYLGIKVYKDPSLRPFIDIDTGYPPELGIKLYWVKISKGL